jgi:murein DD-endopeptidase MepM/ murein hydrolase activator NlpD
MTMVAKMQSLTTGVDKLQKSADNLLKTLTKINDVSASAIYKASGAIDAVGGQMGNGQGPQVSLGTDTARFPDTTSRAYQAMSGRGGGGGGGGGGFGGPSNSMSGSFGNFGYGMGDEAIKKQGQLNIVTSSINMASATLPDVGSSMNNAALYYQAGLKSPGINRKNLERSMLRSMRGGFSDPMGGAMTANILADAGFGPGTQNFKQAAAEVGGAYKYLGMDNAVAAQAIAGMHQGPMGANLYQYGITTYDTKTGKNKTMGQIATELMGTMGGAGATVEQVQSSYQKGALGANLRTMGFSQEQQDIIYQAMIDKASGRDPDLRNAKPVGDNQNQMLTAQGRMSSSQGNLLMEAEKDMIKGFEDAATAVEKFNLTITAQLNNGFLRFLSPMNELARTQGFLGGLDGSTLGNTKDAAKGLLQGILQFVLGDRNPMQGKGGGTTGYGAAFGKGGGAGGGVAPVEGVINAGYGAKGSDMWGSTNGTHTGMDYNVPIGTPVKAALDGVVSQVDINADYGTSIMIDHPNGMQTIYAHLSGKNVKVGDQVSRGQKIGKSGKSGNASGPHLHFEVRNGKNNPVNPSELISGAGGYLNPEYNTLIPPQGTLLGKSKSGSSGSSGSSGTAGIILGTGDKRQWATDFLSKLGKPTTEANINAVTTWMAWEGGHWKNSAHYNPLNTTLETRNATGSMNPVGVQRYASWEAGLDATLQTIRNGRYENILAALQAGNNPQAVFQAVNASPWGTNIPTNSGGSTSGFGGSGLSGVAPGGGGGDRVVNVTLNINRASDDEAMRFARKIKSFLESDIELSRMGSS